MKEIWQTTNQQPWVQALSHGLITCKTRMSRPTVPVGSVVLLHASKSRLWPYWKGLPWTEKLGDATTWDRGVVSAIATVAKVDESDKVLTKAERRFWDVYYADGTFHYNSVGDYAVRFSDILPLKKPIETRGFQAPFARATKETVAKLLKENPYVEVYISNA
jgi:hypothetical protein